MFGFPYRESPLPGFWGEVNSKTNFCEEDYIVTSYVAELINTCTNLTYVFYALYGIRANWGHKNAFLRDLPYLGILTVGIGSTIFHASLKYYTQWCDDLSMLVAVALVLHRVYTAERSMQTTVLSGLSLTILLVAFGVFHCVTDDVAFHNLFFATMIVLVGIKTRALIHNPDAPLSAALRRQLTRLTLFGGVIFVSGYGIWILDHLVCSKLISIRRAIGMPWSFIFELHGYWHIFTGIGAYVFIAEVEYLTGEERGGKLGGRFAWPVNWIVDGNVGNDVLDENDERGPLLPKVNAPTHTGEIGSAATPVGVVVVKADED